MRNDLNRERAERSGPIHVWLLVDLDTFSVEFCGFIERHIGDHTLYVSPSLIQLTDIRALRDSEYGQAVEINHASRTVTFGKDYLGHFPLNFTVTRKKLCISDDVTALVAFRRREGETLRLSSEAVAMYFSTGFGPHGMTPYQDIVSCESAKLYCWGNGRISCTSTFHAIEIEKDYSIDAFGECIEGEVRKAAALSDKIDVWCSGGLDSSILALLCNSEGRHAELITLGYDADLQEEIRGGERFFANAVAQSCGARLREATLTTEGFIEAYQLLVRNFNNPNFDPPPVPKFALARGSRDLFITGEIALGVQKNNRMLFSSHQNPETPLGWFYAVVHERFAHELPNIMVEGSSLLDYVVSYFDQLIESYPGELPLKLMYLDAFYKGSGSNFVASYYSARHYGLRFRHPLGSLDVYRASFKLPVSQRYLFPRSKVPLISLYGNKLPECIIQRRKSGTILPLGFYMERLPASMRRLDALRESGLFHEQVLDRLNRLNAWRENVLLYYAMILLNAWLEAKEERYLDIDISATSANRRRSESNFRL